MNTKSKNIFEKDCEGLINKPKILQDIIVCTAGDIYTMKKREGKRKNQFNDFLAKEIIMEGDRMLITK